MNYQYSYLMSDLVPLVIWLALFFWRKDIRKEMLFMSLIFGFFGFFMEFFYILDWWHPLLLGQMRVGIEDFLFSFSIAGVSSVFYEEIFKKKIKLRKLSPKKKEVDNKKFLLIILLMTAVFFTNFYVFGFNTFYSSSFSLLLPIVIILLYRKDLIIDSLVSGVLILIVALISFNIIELITPGWVASTWFLEKLSGVIILKAPLEDIIWFFLFGAFIGPLYEFWQEGRLVSIKDKRFIKRKRL